MCFSAELSFASAGVLSALGGYCIRAAVLRLPHYWGFAAIPVGFALQQAVEGAVWLGIAHRDDAVVCVGSAIYLFMALAFWPVWFPVAAALAELDRTRSRLLFAWAGLATSWFWFAYLPMFASAPASLTAEVVGHSIHYAYSDMVVLSDVGRWLVTSLYVLSTGVPLLVSSSRRDTWVPVVVGTAATLVSAHLYSHAYTSVWCFFAALLSSYCAYFFATTRPRVRG